MNNILNFVRYEVAWLSSKPIEFQRFYKYLQACYSLRRFPLVSNSNSVPEELRMIARCLAEQEYDLGVMFDRGADAFSLAFLWDVNLDTTTADKIIKTYDKVMGWEE